MKEHKHNHLLELPKTDLTECDWTFFILFLLLMSCLSALRVYLCFLINLIYNEGYEDVPSKAQPSFYSISHHIIEQHSITSVGPCHLIYILQISISLKVSLFLLHLQYVSSISYNFWNLKKKWKNNEKKENTYPFSSRKMRMEQALEDLQSSLWHNVILEGFDFDLFTAFWMKLKITI